jgi:NAD(P)-dependent dehydrogenase (short-subunit alcohol dehydrogenase family)
MPLTDRVAVIIGATGQLGPAVARAFAHAGARLVLVGANAQELARVSQELGFRESRVMTHVSDGMSDSAWQGLGEEIVARYKRLDIVLPVGSSYVGGTVLDTAPEDWEYMLNANFRSALNALRALVPLLVKNEWGRIVTVSSGSTQSPSANVAAYAVAKSALETLTLALAQEVKDKNITANVVLVRALDGSGGEKRPGKVRPEDVAATLLFLCSDEAGAITGARIPVFGGL